MKIPRIRNSRHYNEQSLRLDMAERGPKFGRDIWDKFILNELTQLDIIAYPDYATINNLEDKIRTLYFNTDPSLLIDTGSDAIIKLIIEVFCENNKRILTINPSFPMYKIYGLALQKDVYECGSENIWYIKDDYIELNIDIFLSEIEKIKPGVLFLSNPLSPYGGSVSRADLKRMLDLLKDYNGVLCLDQAYIDFQSSDNQINDDLLRYYDNLLILRTFSKGPGLAGLRIGFCAGCDILINRLRENQLTFPISGPALSFTNLILDNYSIVDDYVSSTIVSRDRVISVIREHDQTVFNSNTNSIHFRLNSELRERFDLLIADYDVKIKRGDNIGTPVSIPYSDYNDWIRMSVFAGIEESEFFKSIWI